MGAAIAWWFQHRSGQLACRRRLLPSWLSRVPVSDEATGGSRLSEPIQASQSGNGGRTGWTG